MTERNQLKSNRTNLIINIIVVNYNGKDSIIDCVDALLTSSMVANIYVVDNCSQDGSFHLLQDHIEANELANVAQESTIASVSCRSYQVQKWVDERINHTNHHTDNHQLHLIQNTANTGFAAANNLVLNYVDGDVFFLVNPDCIVSEDTIFDMATLLQPFIFNKDNDVKHIDKPIGMASCIIRNDDSSIQVTSKRRFPTPMSALVRMVGLNRIIRHHKWQDFNYGDSPYPSEIEDVEALSGAFMAVTSTALHQVGGLDEGYFMHCEDLDWCMRFHQHGFRVVSYQSVEVMHIKEVSSASRPIRVIWFMHRGMIRFFEKFYKSDYSIFIRYVVYLGIVARLIMKVVVAFSKSLFAKLSSPKSS